MFLSEINWILCHLLHGVDLKSWFIWRKRQQNNQVIDIPCIFPKSWTMALHLVIVFLLQYFIQLDHAITEGDTQFICINIRFKWLFGSNGLVFCRLISIQITLNVSAFDKKKKIQENSKRCVLIMYMISIGY